MKEAQDEEERKQRDKEAKESEDSKDDDEDEDLEEEDNTVSDTEVSVDLLASVKINSDKILRKLAYDAYIFADLYERRKIGIPRF